MGAAPENVSGGAIDCPSATGKLVASVNSPSMSASLELKNSSMDANANPVSILQPGAVMPPEAWLHVMSLCGSLPIMFSLQVQYFCSFCCFFKLLSTIS